MADNIDAQKLSEPNPLRLDDDELKFLARQVHISESNTGYRAIFRHARPLDFVVMLGSAVAAAGAGATAPAMTIVMGSLVGKFSDLSNESDQQSFLSEVTSLAHYMVYIAIGTLFLTTIHVSGFTFTGSRITRRLRLAYLAALLRQNMAFLDATGAGEVVTRLTADMSLVQDGISEKIGLAVSGVGAFVASLVIAFVRSWKLALVMLSLPVVVTAWMITTGVAMKNAQATSTHLYATTASFAEEAISSLRNVAAYGLQRRFAQRYEVSLTPAAKAEFRAKTMVGLLVGGTMGLVLSAFALSSWAGSKFLNRGDITIAEIVTVLFASVIAGVSFGQIAPHFGAFSAARAAASRITALIDRRPASTKEHDPEPAERLASLHGSIELKDVKLVYPLRSDQMVLHNLSLTIPAGKTTAIVGPSGSGKSSILYLLERFYLPLRGRILIDGHDLADLDIQWLRSNMKIVTQDPYLFNMTVFDNIAFGLEHSGNAKVEGDAKVRLIEHAAKTANAHDFICNLPKGYQTIVGASGSSLSGGQRQRVAIARALVSNPKILLLDEATAALDSKSESFVQTCLADRSRKANCTTIVIAHRLSSIKSADKIVVMEHGHITEEGTHDTLIAKGGTYASLVEAQRLQKDDTSDQTSVTSGHIETSKEEIEIVADGLAKQETTLSSHGTTNEGETPVNSTLSLIKFLLAMNKNERGLLLLGLIGSAISGLAYPLTAIFYGNLILALRDPSVTLGGHDVNFWAGMQWMTSWIVFFGYVIQSIPFALASARLICRARSVAFAAILRQDNSFFSQPGNDAGILTAFLAQQANQLNGLSGAVLGAILNSLVAVIGGLIVAVSFGWKLGLVGAATMPLVCMTGFARYRALASLEEGNMRHTTAAGMVSESVRGIRTVAAFNLEDVLLESYHSRLSEERQTGSVKKLLLAALFGASQSSVTFTMALLFWYGGTKLLPTGEYNVQSFLTCLVATQYSAQSAGSIFSFAPDMAGAKQAAARLRALCDTVPHIDINDESGETARGMAGDVELRNVSFAYPSGTNPGPPVLEDVQLSAPSGKFIALIGASGSGKSTVLNLIERLYDPRRGMVMADGRDIRRYHLKEYRKQLSIVEQDSAFYSGTVRENILSDVDATDEDIIEACRDANILEFVTSLSAGFQTLVGPRGVQLSGGQKQRLALARAILRRPKILLLDEATSALDSHSEAVVQEALSAAATNRTTIAVAHRLSSIKDADCIHVFDKGKVIESGTHMELMAKRGRYWEYSGLQNIDGPPV